MKNAILDDLIQLNLSDSETIYKYWDKTRDDDSIEVWRCRKSGVFFLQNKDEYDAKHYQEKSNFTYGANDSREEAIKNAVRDSERRLLSVRNMILNKDVLDVGAGHGGMLRLFSKHCSSVKAVEPQEIAKQAIKSEGFDVFESIEEVEDGSFDIVSLFHVLEHIPNQINFLRQCARKLRPKGKIIVEVPHANDFLINHLDIDAFKDFTFWSEHLILHTRTSLQAFMQEAGFRSVTVAGVQRYPPANHLYWLRHGKPGGDKVWPSLDIVKLNEAYENMLASIDQTDTLFAVGTL